MFGRLFGRRDQNPIRLVVALNQVDKIYPNGWNERLNMPTKEAEKEIERRSEDIIKKLSKVVRISPEQMEYYSALKRYRLPHLLNKVIRYGYAGFKLDDIQPADPFELADSEVKAFADQQRLERRQAPRAPVNPKEQLFSLLESTLSKEDFALVQSKLKQESKLPPKIAIFGKAGVGKTTTVNNLFNAQWKTSSTVVGTTEAQVKSFDLATGGSLTIVDLPGYGRSLKEDREYEKIYQELIPTCDVVLLVLQANTRDFTDDQEMLLKVKKWLEQYPVPQRK